MKTKTVGGQEIDIQVNGGTATVDKSAVTKTDIPASNGVIHVIDAIMMPN
jgi:uncharacterized surface protein with fasciclin (FAS1) repeats